MRYTLLGVTVAWALVATMGATRRHRADLLDGAVGATLGAVATATTWWLLALPAPAWVLAQALRVARARDHRQSHQRSLLILLAGAVIATVVIVTLTVAALVDERIPPQFPVVIATLMLPAAIVAAAIPWVRSQADRMALAGIPAFAAITVTLVAVSLSIDVTTDRVLQHTLAAVAVATTMTVSGPARIAGTQRLSRALYGSERSPRQLLGTLTSEISRALPLEDRLGQMVSLLGDQLGLDSVELWAGASEFHLRAMTPWRAQEPFRLPAEATAQLVSGWIVTDAELRAWGSPLAQPGERIRAVGTTHAGVLHGILVARRAAAGAAFHVSEERVLADVAHVVGATLHGGALDFALQASLLDLQRQADELLESRARIVAAGDEARRRIERDIHDGAQQALVALAVSVRLAREHVEAGEVGQATALLADLEGEVRETMADLRAITHGIYPPALAAGGLAEALPAAVVRLGLDADVSVSRARRYPEDVEATVYFCCVEALTNSAKHATGSRVEVRVQEEGDWLVFAVRDDGPGFEPAQAPAHHGGLANMRDRVGALRGELTITAAPGSGASIEGRVPASTPSTSPATAER